MWFDGRVWSEGQTLGLRIPILSGVVVGATRGRLGRPDPITRTGSIRTLRSKEKGAPVRMEQMGHAHGEGIVWERILSDLPSSPLGEECLSSPVGDGVVFRSKPYRVEANSGAKDLGPMPPLRVSDPT